MPVVQQSQMTFICVQNLLRADVNQRTKRHGDETDRNTSAPSCHREAARRPSVFNQSLRSSLARTSLSPFSQIFRTAVSVPAAYGVYPLLILIVYVIVTGGILRSPQSDVYLTTYFFANRVVNVWNSLPPTINFSSLKALSSHYVEPRVRSFL